MRITEKHRKVALALIEAKDSRTEIAKKCGIDRKTLYRWLKDEDFQKLMSEFSDIIITETRNIIKYWARESVRRLIYLVSQNPEKVDSETSRKAACDILEMAGLKTKDRKKDSPGNSETTEKLIIEWGGNEKKDQIDYKANPGEQKFDNKELVERADKIRD